MRRWLGGNWVVLVLLAFTVGAFKHPAIIQRDSIVYQQGCYISVDEGFRLKPYTLTNSKSGITVATGFDLGSKSEQGLRDMGIDEALILKLRPALGHTTASAGRASLELKAKAIGLLTYKEARSLDRAMASQVDVLLASYFEGTWGMLVGEEKDLARSIVYQYGARGINFKAMRQLKEGDREGLKANLNNWGDKTPRYSHAINARYKRWTERLNL